MNREHKQYLQSILPEVLYNGLIVFNRSLRQAVRPVRTLSYAMKHREVGARHRKARALVRGRETIKAAFFLIHNANWKYDGLYRLMEQDPSFDPVIIVCPYLTYGEAQMHEELDKAFSTFSQKGYNVIQTRREDGTWLDVKNEIQPDMIFFTSPYPYTRPEYYVTHFPDTLTFYVPYAYIITDRSWLRYQLELHYLVYNIFHESDYHRQQARQHALNRGANSVVTGYPGLDFVFRNGAGSEGAVAAGSRVVVGPGSEGDGAGKSRVVVASGSEGDGAVKSRVSDPWKGGDGQKKRIIWAPHHTIETEKNPHNYSNFLAYHQFFLDLADRYAGQVIFSFKPHPLLKPKLKNLPEWGEERTERYFKTWESRPNCQLDEGLYFDLFVTSDAMIHDSISFLVEYISTGKPSLYMIIDDLVLTGFSALGREIINAHYQSRTQEAVIAFIEQVVTGGDDPLRPEREKLLRRYLQPPNGVSASENIMNEIRRIVDG